MVDERPLKLYRSERTTFSFPWTGAVPTAARLYVRSDPDGELLIRLRSSEVPAQFEFVTDDDGNMVSVDVTVLGTDSSPVPGGNYRYDVKITVAGVEQPLCFGPLTIVADISVDAGSDMLPYSLILGTPVTGGSPMGLLLCLTRIASYVTLSLTVGGHTYTGIVEEA